MNIKHNVWKMKGQSLDIHNLMYKCTWSLHLSFAICKNIQSIVVHNADDHFGKKGFRCFNEIAVVTDKLPWWRFRTTCGLSLLAYKRCPGAQIAKSYCRLRLIPSVWGHRSFTYLEFIKIVNLWVYDNYFGFKYACTLGASYLKLLQKFILTRITDQGLYLKWTYSPYFKLYQILKWCFLLRRNLFFVFQLLG